MPGDPIRIAMWSGPRNISTAFMRSWGNRQDTYVCDEPLYAHYLRETKFDHPGASEVVESHEANWRKVVGYLTGDVPRGKRIFYQKHMAHHLLPNIERDWLERLIHCFLIRDPREMLPSLVKIVPHPTLSDTGLPQQVRIFEEVRQRTGLVPVVLDSRDVLEQPRDLLTMMCENVGVEFTDDMLAWPAGERSTDGVWAPHWYGEVLNSTGFRPYEPKTEPFPDGLEGLHAECLPHYQTLYSFRLCSSNSTKRTAT